MKFWTWAEIRAKIEAECDTEDEDFIRPEELLGLVNEAIDEAEAEIHSLYEDYFIKPATINVNSGDEYVSIATNLPDIYADKIRNVIFRGQGNTVYEVKRIKETLKFAKKAVADTQTTTDLYEYFPVNRTPGNPEMLFVPKFRESGTLTVWYLRNANRLALDTDICDIPEFINFIFAHMKVKIYGKEGHPGYQEAFQKLEMERERMNAVLSNRVPDGDNLLEADTSHYEDMN